MLPGGGHFDPSSMLGALLVGVLFAAFFQGILTFQAYQYYQYFPDDPRLTKIFVAVLWTLDLIHLMLISYAVYHYLIFSWGNIHGVTQLLLPLGLHLIPIALTSLLAQLFFLNRIWIFSGRNLYVTGPVLVCCLVNFGLVLVMVALALRGADLLPGLFVAMASVGVVTDILIAALLCWYLHKRAEGSTDPSATSTLIVQVIRYTVATGAFTSFLILACLIAYLAAPFTFAFVALHFSSGRTYANAVLANLNARRQFRETLENIEPFFAKSIQVSGISSAIRQFPRLQASTRQSSSPRTLTTPTRSGTGENKLESFVQVPEATHSRHSLP